MLAASHHAMASHHTEAELWFPPKVPPSGDGALVGDLDGGRFGDGVRDRIRQRSTFTGLPPQVYLEVPGAHAHTMAHTWAHRPRYWGWRLLG